MRRMGLLQDVARLEECARMYFCRIRLCSTFRMVQFLSLHSLLAEDDVKSSEDSAHAANTNSSILEQSLPNATIEFAQQRSRVEIEWFNTESTKSKNSGDESLLTIRRLAKECHAKRGTTTSGCSKNGTIRRNVFNHIRHHSRFKRMPPDGSGHVEALTTAEAVLASFTT
mmetsp:Transcript_101232/g.284348  ORF Transcript_101232/g.284348 Transcript_101232/m.284348 type:complete len:170 (+) Transcript_101232:50-559(+)